MTGVKSSFMQLQAYRASNRLILILSCDSLAVHTQYRNIRSLPRFAPRSQEIQLVFFTLVKTRSYSDAALVLKLNQLKSEPLKALFYKKIYLNSDTRQGNYPSGTMILRGKADIISRFDDLKSVLTEFVDYQHDYCNLNYADEFFSYMQSNEVYKEIYLNFLPNAYIQL